MAKKKEAPAAEAEGAKPEGEGAEAAPKKGLAKFLSKKMLIIIVPVLLLVIGGGGAGAYFFLFKKSDKSQEARADDMPLTPPKVAFSDMQDILVNIQSNDGTPAYLKLGVSLELDDDAQKTAIQPLMPRITDQFQAYLRELRLDDLKGSAGVLRLKEELLRRVNVAAAPYHVRDVLLKEMIVQ
ncbi:MAG TPA: flagellar basal body-associated FliL family protein [Rhizomicrobium sp.]|jgi:flagellar FliL protein|nr:flagellar basal body-associated FliL family protein [Rhizomicrobium sp.]